MIKILSIWGGLLLSVSAQHAYSADENGIYWIYGVGRQTCETYLEARHNGGFSEMSDSQGVTSITKNSINYSNSRGPLGGLTGINWEEIRVLCQKHFKKVY